jgi:hypothetical protein
MGNDPLLGDELDDYRGEHDERGDDSIVDRAGRGARDADDDKADDDDGLEEDDDGLEEEDEVGDGDAW